MVSRFLIFEVNCKSLRVCTEQYLECLGNRSFEDIEFQVDVQHP